MHSGLLYNEVGLGQYLYGSKIMKERNVCKANVQRLPLMLLSLLQLVAGMVVAPTRKVCKDISRRLLEYSLLRISHLATAGRRAGESTALQLSVS